MQCVCVGPRANAALPIYLITFIFSFLLSSDSTAFRLGYLDLLISQKDPYILTVHLSIHSFIHSFMMC